MRDSIASQHVAEAKSTPDAPNQQYQQRINADIFSIMLQIRQFLNHERNINYYTHQL